MIRATLKVDLKRHKTLQGAIATGTGPVKETLESFERLYRAFVLRRFDRFSRGGGNWKPNSDAVKRAKRSSAILVDSRVMRLGLNVGVRATRITKNSVTFSFTNRARHPSASLTIAQLATVHDQGNGVPKRQILVKPDAETTKRLLDMAKKKYLRWLNARD